MPLLSSNNDGRFTVIYEGGIIAHRVSEPDALAAILDKFPDAPAAEILDKQADPAEFRSLWAAATAAEIQSLHVGLSEVNTSEEVQELRDRQAVLMSAMAELSLDNDQRQIQELQEQIEAERRRIAGVLADEFGLTLNAALAKYGGEIWERLRRSKTYGRLFMQIEELKSRRHAR